MCTHMDTHACTRAHTHTSLLLSAKLLHSLNFECTMMLFHCFLVILDFMFLKSGVGKMAHPVEALASQPDDLSGSPEPTWRMQRTCLLEAAVHLLPRLDRRNTG